MTLLLKRGFASVLILLMLPALGRTAEFKVEAITFPTNSAPGMSNARIRADLYLPPGKSSALSAMVILPSSGGVRLDREIYYATELAGAGIAALIVDSLGSRGVRQTTYDQTLVTPWQEENDAVGALRWLIKDGRFRRSAIGVMGVSKGGVAAWNTSLTIRRKWARVHDAAFAAHVPIAPACEWPNRTLASTGAPVLFLLGEKDDWTPAHLCVTVAEAMRKHGNPRVDCKIYEGAHHAWESITDRPYFDPRAEVYSECRGTWEDDGRMRAASGKLIPSGAKSWFAWAKTSCMKLGATCCGGTRELKASATSDMIAFLKRYGF